jgi:catechol 2,3-dioxygenase-like lactoylglutathione lyase family enzyme
MTADRNPQQRVMPTLRMTDYARSKQFYVDALGFQIDWEHRFDRAFRCLRRCLATGWRSS